VINLNSINVLFVVFISLQLHKYYHRIQDISWI